MNLKKIPKNYLIGIFIFLLVIVLSLIFIKNYLKKESLTEREYYVIISFNKILYKDKNIKDEKLNEAINSYETGYIEKAKFLFNEVLNNSQDLRVKKVALVNLANIFDDLNQFTLACDYLNKAKEIAPKDWIIYHNLGIVYKHLKNYEKALESFKTALIYNKKFVRTYLSAGAIYFYLKNYNEAYKYFFKASKLNPELYEAKYNSAISLLKLQKQKETLSILEDIYKSERADNKIKAKALGIIGMLKAESGNYNEAIFYLDKATDFYEDAEIYYKKGLIYNILGEHSKALDNFKKAYLLNQNNLETISKLAELYYKFGDFEKSLEYYKYLLKKTEKKSEILITIGEIYSKIGNYDEAIKYYSKVLESSPLPADMAKIVYLNLGNLYSELNKYEESYKNYKKALEYDNLDVNIYYNISVLLLNQKYYQEAIINLKKALEIEPSNLLLNLLLARSYILIGDREQGIITYSKIIEKFPNEIAPYFELANLYYKILKFKEALHYYEILLKLKPPKEIEYKVYINLGVIYQNLNDYNKSLEFLMKSYAINPTDCYINYNLGIYHLNKKEIDKAENYFKVCLRLNCEDELKALVHLGLGNCYYEKKDIVRAKYEYEQALKYDYNLTEAHYNLKLIEKKI